MSATLVVCVLHHSQQKIQTLGESPFCQVYFSPGSYHKNLLNFYQAKFETYSYSIHLLCSYCFQPLFLISNSDTHTHTYTYTHTHTRKILAIRQTHTHTHTHKILAT